MLPSQNIQSIIGATVHGRDRTRIGRVDQVLVDAADGHPTWAVVNGGLFGRTSLYVPLEEATWEHDDVFVELDKDDVKNAPHPDPDGGLTPEQEQELRDYYRGLGADDRPDVATPEHRDDPAKPEHRDDPAKPEHRDDPERPEEPGTPGPDRILI
ncbi:PRC-barrel domain-containing protein [Herbiconiux sp.]|uniref:PRC-barrel domain-containing protein n=1 Tax=Herbiconiux sp. TaxID=1871186 RepID=UPI0025C33385|nr:PRC-barrel domain-containing protein [Herbiconiux sp.]